MLPSATTAALLRRLHHLLVFTSSILEPDFHLQQKSNGSGQVKLVSRLVSGVLASETETTREGNEE